MERESGRYHKPRMEVRPRPPPPTTDLPRGSVGAAAASSAEGGGSVQAYADAKDAAMKRPPAAGVRRQYSGLPVGMRYEAIATPQAFTAKRPWWAFLISYRNFRITAMTFLYWGACIAMHQSATALALHRGTAVHPDMRTAPPLHDLGHELLPNTQRYRVIPEVGHLWPIVYLSVLMLYHFDQRSLDCFRTFLWCHGTLMIMRASCFSATLLPDSSQQCHTSLFVGSCHDLIFSGHAMIMTLSAISTGHFFPEALPVVLRWVLLVNQVVTSVMIVSSRNHYSVDVLLSLFMTPFVFLSWTRHPLLASLACADPTHVLALPSKLESSPRAASDMCGCTNRRRAKLNALGYPDEGEDALARVTKHAHASLSLLGLQPHVIVFRTEAGGAAVRQGSRGEAEEHLDGGSETRAPRPRNVEGEADGRRSTARGQPGRAGAREGRWGGGGAGGDPASPPSPGDGGHDDELHSPLPAFVRIRQGLRRRWQEYRTHTRGGGTSLHEREGEGGESEDGGGSEGAWVDEGCPSPRVRRHDGAGVRRPSSADEGDPWTMSARGRVLQGRGSGADGGEEEEQEGGPGACVDEPRDASLGRASTPKRRE